MNRTPVAKIIALLAFGALVMVCCAALSDLRSGSGGGEVQTIPLGDNSGIVCFDANLTRGGTAWVHIVSDRPLDLLVMDRKNFTNYYAAEQGNSTSWSPFAAAVNVTAGGLNYTAPADGDYLFIIDNTPLNAGGAPGDRQANFSASFAYQWSHYPIPLSWFLGN